MNTSNTNDIIQSEFKGNSKKKNKKSTKSVDKSSSTTETKLSTKTKHKFNDKSDHVQHKRRKHGNLQNYYFDTNGSKNENRRINKSGENKEVLGEVDEEELRDCAFAIFGDDADIDFDVAKTKSSIDAEVSAADSGVEDNFPLKMDDPEFSESDNEVENEEEEEEEICDLSTSDSKRKPAWVDEDDDGIKVKDVVATYTKARGSRGARETSDEVYEKTLREKYNMMTGKPEWADLDRVHEDSDEETPMNKNTGNRLLKTENIETITKGQLSFKKLKDLNSSSYNEGSILKSVQFIPSCSSVQVALVAGCSKKNFGAATLFQVDGKENHKIHSEKYPKFPIKCARFLRDGRRFAVGSNLYGHFFVYDMEASKSIRLPWNKSEDRRSMKLFEVSPDGRHIVFIGKNGHLHLFDTVTLSHVETMKVPGEVLSLAFNEDGSRMYTPGYEGQVFIWDMNTRQCIHKFYDDGCIEGTSIDISPNSRLLACGSSSGIVNIYDTNKLGLTTAPRPIKTVTNLRTSVTGVKFNSTSEILAFYSDITDNAVKMLHIPSMTVFSNFPSQQSVLRRPQDISFSPNSGYFAMGNNFGAAHLYRLNHYSAF